MIWLLILITKSIAFFIKGLLALGKIRASGFPSCILLVFRRINESNHAFETSVNNFLCDLMKQLYLMHLRWMPGLNIDCNQPRHQISFAGSIAVQKREKCGLNYLSISSQDCNIPIRMKILSTIMAYISVAFDFILNLSIHVVHSWLQPKSNFVRDNIVLECVDISVASEDTEFSNPCSMTQISLSLTPACLQVAKISSKIVNKVDILLPNEISKEWMRMDELLILTDQKDATTEIAIDDDHCNDNAPKIKTINRRIAITMKAIKQVGNNKCKINSPTSQRSCIKYSVTNISRKLVYVLIT